MDTLSDDDSRALVAQLRAGGSVFAEEELDELRAHAELVQQRLGWDLIDVLEGLVHRRVHGETIEHIVERAQFGELRVAVEHGVFVPRRRTLLLATVVADRLRELAAARPPAEPRPRLLDLGCGSGAIAALAAHRVPGIEVVAIDRDPNAVECARGNLPRALVVHADRIEALAAIDATRAPGERGIAASAPFDVIAANLPYVPTGQLAFLPRGTLDAEPVGALDGGDTGIEPLREHAGAMAAHLRSGGIAVTEVAPHQVGLATECLLLAGFADVEERSDDELGATVLIATR